MNNRATLLLIKRSVRVERQGPGYTLICARVCRLDHPLLSSANAMD